MNQYIQDGRFVLDLDQNYYGRGTAVSEALEGIRRIVFTNDLGDTDEEGFVTKIRGDVSNVRVSTMEFGRTSVTAVAFADVRSGLVRAGEHPQDGDGEVKVVMLVDAEIPESAMARALITITEGITAVMQDLRLRYDGLSASGSVDQDITVLCRKDCGLYLRGAGNHCKLGELLGRATIESVRESAYANGCSIDSRKSVIRLMSEYGYPIDIAHPSKEKDSDPKAINAVESIIRINECIEWKLIPSEDGKRAMINIIRTVFDRYDESSDPMEMLQSAVLYHFG